MHIRIYKYTNNKYYKNRHYKYTIFEVNYYLNHVRNKKAFKTEEEAFNFYKSLQSESILI